MYFGQIMPSAIFVEIVLTITACEVVLTVDAEVSLFIALFQFL